MDIWLNDIIKAFANLGGAASYKNLYVELGKIRGLELTTGHQAGVRKEIEKRSSDSEVWKQGSPNIFRSVLGKGKGVWGLRVLSKPSPIANDIFEDLDRASENPRRKLFEVYRIIRDTALTREIKALHQNRCQLCGKRVALSRGEFYSEAHHLQPLGKDHNGPDISENIIVVCPTCHVLCDYNSIHIKAQSLLDSKLHDIGQKYIEYHNNRCTLFGTSA